MEDFLDSKALLEKYKGAETVTGDEDMAEKMIFLFEHESMRKERGENAQRALKENQGSSFRHTRVISELLEKRKTGGKNGCR
jgi:3-deoxy-D-manno-octulosonic-acid transferase